MFGRQDARACDDCCAAKRAWDSPSMRIGWYWTILLVATVLLAIVVVALEFLRRRGVIGQKRVDALEKVGDFLNRLP